LVERTRGPDWDDSRGIREQDGFDDHALFMDALVDEGFVVLGRPVGAPTGERTLLVVRAASEDEVRARLREDPWPESFLAIRAVEPWTVWLRASGLP
jgi:hypothetical protein